MSDSPVPVGPLSRGEYAARVVITILLVVLTLALWRMRDVLLIVFAGVLVGIILNALSHRIGRLTGLGHRMALAVATISLFGLLAGLFYFFGQEISSQLRELGARLPQAWADLTRIVADSGYQDQVNEQIKSSIPSGGTIISILSSLVSGISGSVTGLALAVMGGIYMAAQPGVYQQGVVLLAPKGRAQVANHAIGRAGFALRAWLKGQFISMTFTAVFITVGLTLIGVPTPVALGLIAGLCGFIPMIGPLVGAAVGLLVALTVDTHTFLMTVLLYLVVQQLAGSVIEPLIMQRTVKVPPALTLFGLLAIGALFGVVGVLLGGPILVSAYVLARELYVKDALGHPVTD
ncbi:AI-2E family transporter [Sandaracinobacter neustonicus]|uniref:AI-2E family transporter n=1 Tax=Sandaracinobacter neustonicus TaxID=1715348 RepID=A0A501XGK1_9SPHN|nr:AI-2E family transporter [Sandaracinobacter neustonicus]TPE59529.1 AI-2E family transporter [Sandaracinobacter neustonicus]